jgi:hypothetical protein
VRGGRTQHRENQMSTNFAPMQRHEIFFASQGRFTACPAWICLLKMDVEIFKYTSFASRFFEGKPRSKNKNKTPQRS